MSRKPNDAKIGVSLWLDKPLDELVELGIAAENAGFTDLWFPDHYFLRDVFAAQTAVAQATNRIKLAAGVLGVPIRHPALIASSSATIDEISGGRAIIGLGSGGIEFASQLALRPKSPLTVIRDTVEIIRQLLRNGSDHVGDVYTAKGAALGWPTREIPIILAARGPRMMKLAGEIADGLIVHGVSDEYIAFVKERVAIGAARASRSPDECEVILQLHVEIAATRAEAIEVQRSESTIMAGGKFSDSMIPRYGLDPTELARLRKSVTAGDPRPEQFVTDEMVKAFCVGGPLDYCADRLRMAQAAGADRLIFGVYSGLATHITECLVSVAPLIEELAEPRTSIES